jgi:proline iminopeptidase
MKTLYPLIEPYRVYFLSTESQHLVYIEESGNPQGIPILFLHGGPCSGTKPDHRCFFNPQSYRIILMDQRGCGLSHPFGELKHNTTQYLIEDIEQLRQKLAISQWILFGGSWGATLALLYAQTYPQFVQAMILRGVFLARKQDGDWFLNEGVNRIYPELWQQLIESVPHPKYNQLLDNLCDGLWGNDELTQRRVAKAWLNWGAQVALGKDYQSRFDSEFITEKLLKQVGMELHYAQHHYFIREQQILKYTAKICHIPTILIHGRYDLVCPIESAVTLHKHLSDADFRILPNSAHIARGDEMIDALISATDQFAQQFQ